MGTTRGQAALEFMFMMGLAIIVLGISLAIYVGTNTDAVSLGNKAAASAACNQVAATVSAVAAGGNGTQAALHLPPTIGGSGYNVSVNSTAKRVSVNYAGGFQSCPLQTSNVTSNANVNKTGIVSNSGGVTLG
ncbi:Uncharacterised protein [uncultured archaeon]|nr:Uncharacterised protein [uncultured archaeon]